MLFYFIVFFVVVFSFFNNFQNKLHSSSVYNIIKFLFYIITKTCLYNFDPPKPYFYIVKLGFTGVYIIFLISAQKHRLWVEAVLTSTHNLCFEQKYEKTSEFLSENFQFLVVKFLIYLNRCVFVMFLKDRLFRFI